MAAANKSGLVAGIRFDLRRMHETWMELFFPRQRGADSSVLGKWKPTTPREQFTYNAWYYLGVPVIGFIYPLVVFGYILRYQSRRLDSTAMRLGTVGVILFFVLLWGGLTAASYYRFGGGNQLTEGVIAVGAASLVAVLASALAVGFRIIGGRGTTVVFAYPLAMTAIFLPPVVAALYSPRVAQFVFPRSQTLNAWLLQNVLNFGGIDQFFRTRFELDGVTYVGMWFAIAVPVGWFLGILVTLADLVRPTASSDDEDGGE
jgi:hypothetical protein